MIDNRLILVKLIPSNSSQDGKLGRSEDPIIMIVKQWTRKATDQSKQNAGMQHVLKWYSKITIIAGSLPDKETNKTV